MGIVYNANWPLLYERTLSKRITGLENKFISPALLGDDIEIITTAASESNDSYNCEARVNGELVNSAEVFPCRTITSSMVADFDELEIQPYHDELTSEGTLTAVSFLRYCERARTEKIGGPLSIQRGIDEGVAIVVAKLSMDISPGQRIDMSSKLTIRSRAKLRRRKMASFRHELYAMSTPNVAIASCDCTCLAMGALGRENEGVACDFLEWMI